MINGQPAKSQGTRHILPGTPTRKIAKDLSLSVRTVGNKITNNVPSYARWMQLRPSVLLLLVAIIGYRDFLPGIGRAAGVATALTGGAARV
jgi:hypothetical protein